MNPDSPQQNTSVSIPDYGYTAQRGRHAEHVFGYLFPRVQGFLPRQTAGLRVLDVGCGDGYWSGRLSAVGCHVVGVDPSAQGVALARAAYPGLRFEVGEVSRGLIDRLAEPPFDIVLSTEVVEHVYLPKIWADGCLGALKPGGRLICSTPYHGYLKNLVLSLGNRWDRHASPLWDGGHIKLWSRRTLGWLLAETGFENIRFVVAGRCPYLWKSMVLAGDRPR